MRLCPMPRAPAPGTWLESEPQNSPAPKKLLMVRSQK